jgi:zinc D-Ala-D-Ala carboxypeptidase
MIKCSFFFTFLLASVANLFASNTSDSIIYDKAFLLGKINYSADKRFVAIEDNYSGKVGTTMYLLKATYGSYKKMADAARKEGVSLKIVSAGRNFEMQKGIWERKWNARREKFKTDEETALDILKYSSMPGTSRHHWGTDLDINSVDPAYFRTAKGKKELEWLEKNARNYGFCKTYNDKTISNRTGYSQEDWHWSYLPLSVEITLQYASQISLSDITGFKGSDTAKSIDVIKNYVLGIATDCQKVALEK